MISDFFITHKKKLFGLLLFLIILSIIIYYLSIDWGHSVLYDNYDYYYANKSRMVGYEKIKDSYTGIKYSYSIFIRTDNIPANAHWQEDVNNLKIILDHQGSPNILYSRKENKLIIQIYYKNKNDVLTPYEIIFEDFESQMWVHLAIVVDDQNVCVYKNKILEKCIKLPAIPWRSNKMMYIGYPTDNFNGYIGYIDYFNYAIKPYQVQKYYDKHISRLPNKLMSYEQYEYLKKKRENSNFNFINKK